MSLHSSRLSDLQGKGEEASRGQSRSDLQLRATPLHSHVLGEGGSQEPPRRLPMRQVQERDQLGGGDRRPGSGAGRPGESHSGGDDRRPAPDGHGAVALHRSAAVGGGQRRRGRRGTPRDGRRRQRAPRRSELGSAATEIVAVSVYHQLS
jgi:hypothetical protein